jgi:hypothetical protein
MTSAYDTRPTMKNTGIDTKTTTYGSMACSANAQKARYMPSIRNSPWAKFTTRMIPKISVSPTAIRA